jgi:hypothetical protein
MATYTVGTGLGILISFIDPDLKDGDQIPKAQLPKDVTAKIKAQFPANKVTFVGWDTDDGTIQMMTLTETSDVYKLTLPNTLTVEPHMLTIHAFDDKNGLTEAHVWFAVV